MNIKVKKKSLQTSLDKAVALQQAGELDAAEKLFKQVLALEPRQPAALYSLAALASGRSEFAQALKYIVIPLKDCVLLDNKRPFLNNHASRP